MAKKQSKEKDTKAAGMTVSATPRVMSALPPRTRIKDADVQGVTTKKTATRVEGTVTRGDGIVQRGHTKGRIT